MICIKCNEAFDSLCDNGMCVECYTTLDERTVEISLDRDKTFMMTMDGQPNTDNVEFYIHDHLDTVYAFKVNVKEIPLESQKLLGITTNPIEEGKKEFAFDLSSFAIKADTLDIARARAYEKITSKDFVPEIAGFEEIAPN